MRHLLPALALLAACVTVDSTESPSAAAVSVAAPVVASSPPSTPESAPVEAAEVEPPAYQPIYWPAEVPLPTTVEGLCEPQDARWPYPTPDQREQIQDHIRATCSALGVSKSSCRFFLAVSLRESSYRPWVRHKRSGDKSAAMNGYLRVAHHFGWDATWSWPDRKQERIEKIQLRQFKPDANPWYVDPNRWISGGVGLGGVNIANHLGKIDRHAPPEVLCDPALNVMVQVQTARNAVDRYGARNWLEVQAVYAGRTYMDDQGRARPLSCAASGCPRGLTEDERRSARKGDANMMKRCASVGLDCLAAPELGRVLRGRDVTPAQRYELAEKIRGFPLPPMGAPPTPTATVLTAAEG